MLCSFAMERKLIGMKKYTKEELDAIHEVEKETLADFAKVCQKYNLSYFLLAGAALGAVRHQGPIPWDDDIDLGMLRKDYEKFLKVCHQELGDKYIFNNYKTEKDYPLLVTGMNKKGTRFVRENYLKLKCTLGMGIDIFPFDNVPQDDAKRKKQISQAWFWNKLYIVRNISRPQVPGNGIVKQMTLLACGIAHGVMAFLKISRKRIINRYLKVARRYDNEDTGIVATFSDTYPEKTKIYLKDLFPLKQVPYMDIEVFIPNNYDKVLTDEYGDYMAIPSVEKRKSNRPYILQFSEEDGIR